MKKRDKVTYPIAFLIILSIILSFFLEIKTSLIISISLTLILAYIFYKEKIGQELIIAFLIALIITSYYYYEYTTSNFFIGKINLFPLFSWTLGLVILREIYERLPKKHSFYISIIIYIIIIFLVEYIGYYVLGIKLNSNFPSLLNLGIIHASLFLKIVYLLTGPVYLLITDYLKVK